MASGEHFAGNLRAEGVGAIEQRRFDHGKGGIEENPQPEQRKDESLGGAQAGHASRL
jgi:hypothetical protein